MAEVLFVEWCAKDALDGMSQMEPLTELAYRRIMDMIYATNDELLDDDKVLQYSTKTGSKWKAIKKSLIEVHKKIYVEGGKIRQKKCTEKLEKSRKNIAQKSEAAKAKHEKAKSLKDNNSPPADAHPSADAAEHADAYANQEPKNPSKKNADEPPDIFALGSQLAEITGWADDPNWMGNYSRIGAWLEQGMDFDLDILPAVKEVMRRRKSRSPPGSLNYFDRAIADAHATRTKPLPEGTSNARSNPNPSAVDALYAGFATAAREDTIS